MPPLKSPEMEIESPNVLESRDLSGVIECLRLHIRPYFIQVNPGSGPLNLKIWIAVSWKIPDASAYTHPTWANEKDQAICRGTSGSH